MNSARRTVVLCEGGAVRRRAVDELAVEEPLEIRLDAEPLAVTMRTPGHDEELAAGCLFSEGLIGSRQDIRALRRNPRNRTGNGIDVFLSPDVALDRQRLRRRGFVSSSCGICGREAIDTVRKRFPPVRALVKFKAEILLGLPAALRKAQPTFQRTGGLHAAGVFTEEGDLVVAREDIGRHNAVDKVIGYGLLNGLLPYERCALVVSGRASFEIMQKSLAARLPVVCAVSAPSSLAVEFARSSRQTLVGFLRDARMNIYTGVRRVSFSRK